MKKYFIPFIIICFYQPSFAQIMWQYSYGGSGPDWGSCIKQTTDGGYIVAGAAGSTDGDVSGLHNPDATDYWVIKLSATGSLQWQKCLGGSSDDNATVIAQTYDGGYIVAGNSYSINGDVTGHHGSAGSEPDFWVVKLSDTGGIEWQKSLGGSNWDETSSVIQTFDSGYLVAGGTNSTDGDVSGNHGNGDGWIVKLSSGGNVQWQKCLGGSGDDGIASVIQTADSGYMIAGSSNSDDGDVSGNHGESDYWIAKLSSSGGIQWQKCYGGSSDDWAIAMAQATDGSYVIIGYSLSNDGNVTGNDSTFGCTWVIKLSASGDIQWENCYGTYVSEIDYSIAATADDGCIISGVYAAQNWIFKLSPSGIMEWQTLAGNGVNHPDFGTSVIQTTDHNYVFAGATEQDGPQTFPNVYVVKLGQNVGVPNVSRAPALSVFPNPTAGMVNVTGTNAATIKVYDMLGREVNEEKIKDNFSISDLPDGMYILRIFDKQQQLIYQDKLVKISK